MERRRVNFEIASSDLKFVYQKVNKIVPSLEYLFPDKKIDELISLCCYDDEIIKVCFEKNILKIKDPAILGILDNHYQIPITNYKRMLLSQHFKNIKENLIKMDDLVWNILERLLDCKIEIIEKNLLPSRKDNPTFKYHLENEFSAEKKVYLLHDPATNEYYPIKSLSNTTSS